MLAEASSKAKALQADEHSMDAVPADEGGEEEEPVEDEEL